MSPNKALVQRFYGDVVGGNVDLIDELADENLIEHDEFPVPGPPS